MDSPSLSRNSCRLSLGRACEIAVEGIGRGEVDESMATKGGDGNALVSREVVGQGDEGDGSGKALNACYL